MSSVREASINLLNASLEVLSEAAEEIRNKESVSGEELSQVINDYLSLYELSKNFLSEEELKQIKERYKKVQEMWAPGYP